MKRKILNRDAEETRKQGTDAVAGAVHASVRVARIGESLSSSA